MDISRSAMGAKTLPGEYFWSSEVYEEETRKIFRKQWICVGRASDVPVPGDYFIYELDGENFIFVRDDQNRVNCFYNVCRHRGTRLCEQSCGHVKQRIQCPYHAWTYDLNGSLKSAPNMTDVEDFNLQDYPLQSVHCVVWQGFLLINLDHNCTPFESSHSSILSRFDDWELEHLVSTHRITYDVQANWKAVFQNYNECYHCSLVHPQLNPATSVKTASNDFEEGPFLGGPMLLTDNYETFSMDGALCGDIFHGLSEDDRDRVYFYTFFPSVFISPHPDYVLTHRIERKRPNSTRIVCDWLFAPHVIGRSGFDPAKAIEFWDLTNRQDWHVCELTQQGVCSESYQPGLYSNLESISAAFDRHYLKEMECNGLTGEHL